VAIDAEGDNSASNCGGDGNAVSRQLYGAVCE
jgi:hypothetical protein